jgi:hypothetical protein
VPKQGSPYPLVSLKYFLFSVEYMLPLSSTMRTNTIEIPEKFTQQLANLPESATFIHKVKVALSSGQVLSNRVVFNKTILHLEEGEDFMPDEITHMELELPSHLLNELSL